MTDSQAFEEAVSKWVDVEIRRLAETTVQNDDGHWVPAIPLPFYLFAHRHRCECGRTFWTNDGYRGHYALRHILRLRAS